MQELTYFQSLAFTNIYRLEVLRFHNLRHLLELEIVRLQKDSQVEDITIVDDEIRHGQGILVTHEIGGSG